MRLTLLKKFSLILFSLFIHQISGYNEELHQDISANVNMDQNNIIWEIYRACRLVFSENLNNFSGGRRVRTKHRGCWEIDEDCSRYSIKGWSKKVCAYYAGNRKQKSKYMYCITQAKKALTNDWKKFHNEFQTHMRTHGEWEDGSHFHLCPLRPWSNYPWNYVL